MDNEQRALKAEIVDRIVGHLGESDWQISEGELQCPRLNGKSGIGQVCRSGEELTQYLTELIADIAWELFPSAGGRLAWEPDEHGILEDVLESYSEELRALGWDL